MNHRCYDGQEMKGEKHGKRKTYLCGEENVNLKKFEKINKLDDALNKYWQNETME